MKIVSAALGAAAILSAGVAIAAAPDVVKTRRAGQALLSGDFTAMRAVVAAKGDVKQLENPAKAMARWIRNFPDQFPPGTDKGDTKALPTVWSDPAGFQKAAENLANEADKLAEIAKTGDTDQFAAQLKIVGDACAACHKDFRQR